jgi:RNA-splicing ligase RtcB
LVHSGSRIFGAHTAEYHKILALWETEDESPIKYLRSLSLDEYRKEMRGIWSSVICKDSLEESPMAYKKAKNVLAYIGESVDVEQRLKPLYNFKAIN